MNSYMLRSLNTLLAISIDTVKPLIFACGLFYDFHQVNKSAKLMCVNISTPSRPILH